MPENGMRRPSPLPPPAQTPAAPAQSTPPPAALRTDKAPAADDRPGDDFEPFVDASPLLPFERARPRPLPASLSERPTGDLGAAAPGDPARDGDPAPDGEHGAPIGVRDVWRAARARRRALRAEVRRFTARQRRRRMVWLGVAIAVVVLVLGTVGAAYSPLFAVRSIEVVGTAQLDPAAVEDALDGQLGAPLALVDASAVKAALVAFPLVESYTLEARPPSDLVVRIVERTPVGVVETGAGFTVVDAAGVALSTTPEPPAGQPLLQITGGLTSPAFRAAGQVVRSAPAGIRPLITAVSATTPDDVTLTLGATDTRIMWGSAEHSAEKSVALDRAMVARPPDGVRLYDVSSPDVVVVG